MSKEIGKERVQKGKEERERRLTDRQTERERD